MSRTSPFACQLTKVIEPVLKDLVALTKWPSRVIAECNELYWEGKELLNKMDATKRLNHDEWLDTWDAWLQKAEPVIFQERRRRSLEVTEIRQRSKAPAKVTAQTLRAIHDAASS